MTENDFEKMNSSRPGDLKDRLIELQDEERRAEKIIRKLKPFTFESFEKKFLNENDTETLEGAYKSYISELKEKQPATASNYECALNSFNLYREGALLSDVTVEFLKKYESFMEAKSPTTVSMYVRTLRTIINKAIAEGDFPQEAYPFGRYKYQPPQANNKKRSIPIDVIGKIYNYKGEFQKAKDFWLFSYFGNGLNIKDISRLKFSDIDTDRDIISYQRAKTVRTKRNSDKIEIDYTQEMKRIVKKYSNGGGKDDYIFPILSRDVSPERERQLVQQFTHVVNDHLKIIAEKLKIKSFTTYSARHAWSTVQRDAGVPVAAISKMLGHSDTKTTQAYLNSLDTKTIKMASKNLLAFKRQKPAKVVNL